jgi:hypothetical protein
MKIESLRDYEQALHIVPKRELPPDLQTRKDALDKELEVLSKHLSFLESDLERMVVMHPGDLGAIAGKREQMTPVKTKIAETEKKIQVLYVHPYAEAVWEEGEAILHHLKGQVQEAWAEALENKERFIKALARIGLLVKESERMAAEVSEVRFNLLPARNPMERIKTANHISLPVSLEEVNKLVSDPEKYYPGRFK